MTHAHAHTHLHTHVHIETSAPLNTLLSLTLAMLCLFGVFGRRTRENSRQVRCETGPRALPQRGPRHTRARGPLVSGSRGFPSGSPSALRPLAAAAAHAPCVCPPSHGVLRKKAIDRPEKSCVRTAREVRAVCFSNGLWGGEAAGRSRPPPPQGTWAAVTEDMSPGGLAGNSCPSGSRGTTARYGGCGGQLPRPDSARGAPGGSASSPPPRAPRPLFTEHL